MNKTAVMSEGTFVQEEVKSNYSEGVYSEWWEVVVTTKRWSSWLGDWRYKVKVWKDSGGNTKLHSLRTAQYYVSEILQKYKRTKRRIESVEVRHVVVEERWVRGDEVHRIDDKKS